MLVLSVCTLAVVHILHHSDDLMRVHSKPALLQGKGNRPIRKIFQQLCDSVYPQYCVLLPKTGFL